VDIRAAQARENNRLAGAHEAEASLYRAQRDYLICLLRAEDPGKWTYAVLARDVGVSPELVAKIFRTRQMEER
jgi:hypothetical protein